MTSSWIEPRSRVVGVNSAYICQCFKVSEDDLLAKARSSGCYDFDELRRYYDIGSRCTSCEVEIRDLLHEVQHERAPGGSPSGIPLIRRLQAAMRPVPSYARFLARKVLRIPRRFEVFAVKGQGFASELVLSNLTFPDDESNVNGDEVHFDIVLRDHAGVVVGSRKGERIRADESLVFPLDLLLRPIGETFFGTVAVWFYGLRETGSLRPYCRLRYKIGSSMEMGSCHYHDQFTQRRHYQHVIVTHPVLTEETCWVALSNPVMETYRSKAHLEGKGNRLITDVMIPPGGAIWSSIPDLFGVEAVAEFLESSLNSFFWLESDAPLMAWFFWHNPRTNAWSAQHK